MRAPRRPRRGRPTDRCRTHVFHCRFHRGLSPRKITVRTDFKERAETEREASGAGRSRGAGARGKRRAGGPADSPRAATGGIPTEPDGAKARRPAVRGLSVRPGAGGAAPSRACRPCTCGGFRGRKPNEPHAEGRRTKDSRPPPDVHLRRGAKTRPGGLPRTGVRLPRNPPRLTHTDADEEHSMWQRQIMKSVDEERKRVRA